MLVERSHSDYHAPISFQATDNKYDRQLRLWGKEGQQRLAEANVLVLGAGPTATETLKNLVLPGLGRFTVVDDALVLTPPLPARALFLTAVRRCG